MERTLGTSVVKAPPFTDPQEQAKFLVMIYVNQYLSRSDPHIRFKDADVNVVWFSKTLQNWKALVTTTLLDGVYYEITHNGERKETYLDAYKKFDRITFPDNM